MKPFRSSSSPSFISLLHFLRTVLTHEVQNLILTDELHAPNCKAPAFRFFSHNILVLNQLIPTDPQYSTCSWHDDLISSVQMCGGNGVPYQCALYLDNTCGNGNFTHDGKTKHVNFTPDITQAYKVVFSDPDSEWVQASWDETDQEKMIGSYECLPSTEEEYADFTGEQVSTDDQEAGVGQELGGTGPLKTDGSGAGSVSAAGDGTRPTSSDTSDDSDGTGDADAESGAAAEVEGLEGDDDSGAGPATQTAADISSVAPTGTETESPAAESTALGGELNRLGSHPNSGIKCQTANQPLFFVGWLVAVTFGLFF